MLEKVKGQRPNGSGPEDVRIEYHCPCGTVWAEWSPSKPDRVFQRGCTECGTVCFGG